MNVSSFIVTILLNYIIIIPVNASPLAYPPLNDYPTNTWHETTSQNVVVADYSTTEGVQGTVVNQCSFTIYVRQAIAEFPSSRPGEQCANYGETEERAIAPGETYNAPILAAQDTCGHSLKISRTSYAFAVYQLEYNWSLENGEVWYNLSSDTAAPFQNFTRAVSTSMEGCPRFQCSAGESGPGICDYPVIGVCEKTQGVTAVVC